jgi:hypothetical protein
MADPQERAEYHRQRAEQFRANAENINVPSIREMYAGLARMEEALAAVAHRLSLEQEQRNRRQKPIKWLSRKTAKPNPAM